MDTDLTAPLSPAAEAALLRLERALAVPVDAGPGVSAADRAAHEAASYVRANAEAA
jgi:hypothetical protein